MLRIFTTFLILLVVAACTPTEPSPTATATTAPLQGSVTIETPLSGSIIYAEMLYTSGTAENLPATGFRLLVTTTDDTVLSDTVVVPVDGRWVVEIPHGYVGDPVELTVSALPTDSTVLGDYDIVSLVVSDASNRPEGVFGSIINPVANSEMGGDQIEVTGTGSGLFENTLLVELVAEDGTSLDMKILTLMNPYFIDEVIWTTELVTQGYTGRATIRAYYNSAATGEEMTIDEVLIIISGVAG